MNITTVSNTKLVITLFALVGIENVFGQSVEVLTDPYLNFVDSNSFPEGYKLRGDDIWEISVPLGEGQDPTIFLSFPGYGDRSGNIWIAYFPVKGGYRKIEYANGGKRIIQFRPDSFYAGEFPVLAERGGLLVSYQGKGGGSLHQYTFSNATVKTEKVRDLDFSNLEDKDLMEKLFGRDPLKPLPREYFENPPFKVLSVNEIKKKAKIMAGRSGPEDSENKQAQKEVVEKEKLPEPTFAKKLPVPAKEPAGPEASDSEADSNPFPYWIFIIGGVVLAGLVVLLRRK